MQTDKIIKTSDGYKEGAIAGALVGVVLAAYLRKNIMIGAVIGLVGGGYIGYLAKKPTDVINTKFKKI